jgi:predicted GNAT family acetyltransferase
LFYRPFVCTHCSINRDYFETLLRLRLGAKDLLSIPDYYGDDLSVLEFRGEVIGLIAVDYQRPGENLESVIPGVKPEKIKGGLNLGWLRGRGKNGARESVQRVVASTATSTATEGKGSSSLQNRKSEKSATTTTTATSTTKANHLKGTTAHIRHLYVDAQYRNKGLEEELVSYALTRAFTSDRPGSQQPPIQRAIISSPSYASSSLTNLLTKQMPFIHIASGDDAVLPGQPGHEERQGLMVKDTREFGVAGWKVVQWSGQWWEITRQQWEAWTREQSRQAK